MIENGNQVIMTQIMPTLDKITCCIRRDKLWAENYQFDKEHIQNWNAKHISAIWNDLFNIKYIDFRKILHDVQKKNFNDINFSSIINQYEYNHLENNGWIVPTDDDDWFHPDIIKTLNNTTSSLVYWNFVNFTEGVVTVQDSTREVIQYESNNYSIKNVSDESLIRYHVLANNAYRNNGMHINQCLSIHNRTMASLGLLNQQLPDLRGGMIRLYGISRSPIQIHGNIPEYFIKFIEEINDLFKNKLKIKRMFI